MPACITHYEFIKKIASDENYFDVIALAGQGPDPFFFYGYSLKKRSNVKDVRAFGTMLHHIDISPFYHGLLLYAGKKSGEEKRVLYAYIKGLMYHYCLDRNAHPYIFYISGFSEFKNEQRKFQLEHARVESAIDAIYKKTYKEKKNVVQMLKVNKEHLKMISKMYGCVARECFSISYIENDTFSKAVSDMMTVCRIVHSPLKIKKLIFMVFFKNHELNAISSPLSIKALKKYDLLNKNKHKWLNCVNGNIRFEGFHDLFNNAKCDAKKVDEIIQDSLFNKNVEQKIKDFVNGIDHDGFKINAQKRYYKLILGK